MPTPILRRRTLHPRAAAAIGAVATLVGAAPAQDAAAQDAAAQYTAAQDTPASLPRLVVAFVEDRSADVAPGPRGIALYHSLISALLDVPELCVVGQSAVRFALAHSAGTAIADEGPERWVRIGRIAEVDWVLWGECDVDGELRHATLRVVDSADGAVGAEIRAEAGDWQGVREQLFDGIVSQLGLRVDAAARARALAPLARSDAALEHLGHGILLAESRGDAAAVVAALRAAVAEDPASVEALASLAQVLVVQGELDEAQRVTEVARRIAPGDPRAEVATALVLMARANPIAARIRLERARDGAPRWAEPPCLLGRIHATRREWNEAIAAYQHARALAPYRADVHASLARAWAATGRRDLALGALEEVRRIDADGLGFLHEAARTYAELGMVPEALEHSERYVHEARRLGVHEEIARKFEANAAELRARLEMRTVDAPRPRSYTPVELEAALEARLTLEQRRMVVHPFVSDLRLDEWGRELARGTDDPLERSRRIFDALIARINDTPGGGARTALEVHELWGEPTASFNCQELAKLFLAMARAAGVDAYYVHLERDWEDRVVYHDCAAVYCDEGVVLVDPAYRWFGPPHRELTVLDDVEAIAHQLLQAGPDLSDAERIARCRAGVALHPDFAWARVKLAWALIDAERRADASTELELAEQLEPGRWDVALAQGVLALDAGDVDLAETRIQVARAANPTDSGVNRAWAGVLERRGSLEQARDAYRLALRRESDPSAADRIRAALAQIGKELRAR